MSIEQPAALAPGVAPPPRIDLGALLLRRWQPEDLAARLEAVNASFDHLHPWMDWLAEPMTLERRRACDEAEAARWPSQDGSCNYGIFDVEGAVLGAIGIHDRVAPRTVEIGYWCHIAHTGRGVITRSAAALTRIALALPGIDHVEIHCDEANTRSAAIARRLGYRLDRVEPRAIRAPAESGRGMFWVKDNEA
ncbi:GNAT family N-acetyltransferase [Nocardia callitridis]|uniref:GNAT family N-acetyltransferase n=1 Tax=Nocardia callitridis TaxID=648753 RepID=A0ABP9KWV6_9NOCA